MDTIHFSFPCTHVYKHLHNVIQFHVHTHTCKHSTGIAEPAMLWLDTYYQWLAPKSKCCGITDKNQECNAKSDPSCHTCLEPGERNLSRPNVTEFERYLKRFLNDNPGVDCPFGGHAGFSSGVKLNPDGKTVKSKTLFVV